MFKEKLDDKELVILCATLIAIFAMFGMPNPESVVTATVSGLFGVAVGKAL